MKSWKATVATIQVQDATVIAEDETEAASILRRHYRVIEILELAESGVEDAGMPPDDAEQAVQPPEAISGIEGQSGSRRLRDALRAVQGTQMKVGGTIAPEVPPPGGSNGPRSP